MKLEDLFESTFEYVVELVRGGLPIKVGKVEDDKRLSWVSSRGSVFRSKEKAVLMSKKFSQIEPGDKVVVSPYYGEATVQGSKSIGRFEKQKDRIRR